MTEPSPTTSTSPTRTLPGTVAPALPAKTRTAPITVKVGGVIGKIYANPITVDGKDYVSYLVRYPDPVTGKQGNKRFAELAEAREFLAERCRMVANGQASAAQLTNRDASQFGEALEHLAPLGVGVHVAAREYAEAVRLLPSGTNLLDAVRYYAERHPSNAPRKLVSEVVREFAADRKESGCSPIHLRDIDILLDRFAESFAVPISTVTCPQISAYLKALTNAKTGKSSSNRTRANHRAMIIALFNFARLQKYVSREHADEIADLPVPKYTQGQVQIFAPEEFARLLAAAPSELVPALAIAGLAGLRIAEVSRLDWSAVKLAQGVIRVDRSIAKTASTRVVPIGESLARWLAPHAKSFGSVSPAVEEITVGNALSNRFERVAAHAGVSWKRNALRHSFGSYLLAVTSDIAKVANDMGNSPSVIHQHYKSLVTPEEGRAWFAVAPKTDAKIVPLPTAVAA